MRQLPIALLLLVLAAPLTAQEEDLPPGVRLGLIYQAGFRPKVAVRSFASPPELRPAAEEMHAILRRDLDYSDRFQMVDVPQALSSGLIDYRAWDDLGVVYVVTADVELLDEGYQLRVVVHDVVYATIKEIRSFAVPATTDDGFRLAVHAVADEVVQWITGQPGSAATRILFVRQARGGGYDLMVVDSDGENVRRIARSEGILLSPAWSPDGRRVAYALSGGETWMIQEREIETGETRTIVSRTGLAMTPAYSPDGQRLAFALTGGSGTELFEYDLAGRCCLRPITRSRRDDMSPTYSPDGSRLAFNSNRLGPPHIYVMASSGGDAELLSPFVYGEPGYYTSPDWSPVGSLVAFHGRSRGNFQLMVADAAKPGATVRQLTAEGESEDPSWAPDGRHLVFSGVRAGGVGLYVVDTVTGRIRPLVLGGRYLVPDWSPALVRGSAIAVRGP